MRVITPIDGTQHAQAALDALIGMRWVPGTEIKLMTVVPSRTATLPNHTSGGEFGCEQPFNTDVASATQALSTLAQELQQALKECQISYIVREGDAKSEILALASQWKSDLVVIGSRSNKGLERLLLGSVSQAVLTESPCPVIIAKSGGFDELQDLQSGFANVVITVDESSYSSAALRWLTNFSWPSDTRFKLVTVVETPNKFALDGNIARASAAMQQHEDAVRAAKSNLVALASDLAEQLHTNQISVEVGEGEPAEALIAAAASVNANLIVMGSHGRTGLTKLLIGSVSQAVSVHAPCSVAVVRGIVTSDKAVRQKTGVFKLPRQNTVASVIAQVKEDWLETPGNLPPNGLF